MRRTTLFSFLVIGAALAVLFGAGTFAPFTATDDASGSLLAGVITVDVGDENSSDADDAITFDATSICNVNMAPSDTCTATIQICNGDSALDSGELVCSAGDSNLAIIIADTSNVAEDTSDTDSCFSGVISAPSGNLGIVDNAVTSDSDTATFEVVEANDLSPGETATFLLTVSLADLTECQTDSVTYTVTVNAQQSATPHD